MTDSVDEVTRSGMTALIARWNLAYEEMQLQKEIREAADLKIKGCNEVIRACKEACKTFGFDREDETNWKEAQRLFLAAADDLYNRTKPVHLRLRGTAAKQAAEHQEHEEINEGDEREDEGAQDRPSIREIALAQLQAAGNQGLRASDIRDYVQEAYPNSEPLHEKTVGMTLYRLLKAGLARRDGRTWFAAPKGDANAGAVTPGGNNLFD